MTKLFRTESLAFRSDASLGRIQILQPPSLVILTVGVVIAALAIAAFVCFGQYTRKARVSGFLVPDRGVIRLVSPQAAVVIEKHGAEGRAVRRGDILFVLAVGQATPDGDTQAAVQASIATRSRSLEAASQQQLLLGQVQTAAIDQQIAEMRRELAAMAVEGELQSKRLALAQEAQRQFESLRSDNFVSFAQVRTKAEEVLAIQAQLQGIERQRSAQLRQIGALESQRRELPMRTLAQQGEIDRDMAKLAEQSAENEARRRIVIRAPQDGVLTAVMTDVGQSATPAVALASLLPADARLEAHLYAPSSAVGFLRSDQAVSLRYQAFPYQKFGHQTGHVTEVSRSPLQASEMAALSLPAAGPGVEPLYRITVALDKQSVDAYGQPQALSPGMQLEADVLLDRRRLIEWIFEPVLGIAGRV